MEQPGFMPNGDFAAQGQAEERLAELADLLENVHDAIIASDENFVITYWNHAAEQLYGWTGTEALGQNIIRLVHSEVSDQARAEMIKQITQAGVFEGEVIHYSKDGRRLIIEGHTKIRKDAAGRVIGYISANRDVTERGQAEAHNRQLLRDNQRQQSLLDAIFDADPSGLAVIAGPELKFVYVNPTYRFICPQPGIDLIGQTYDQVWCGEEGAIYREQIEQAVQVGRPYQATGFERHYPNGSSRTFTLQVRRIAWEDQPAALVILWDVTERHQAEKRLEAQADLLANISDVIYATDKQLRLTAWNHAAEKIYGWKEKDVLGKSVLDVVQSKFDRVLRENLALELEDKGSVVTEVEHQTQSGATVFFESKTIALRNPDGSVTGYAAVNHDITERKRSEKALRESEEYWRTIVDFTHDWEYWIDPDGHILYNSPSCQMITGRDAAEFTAEPGLLIKIAHPDDRERLESHIQTERGSSQPASLDYRIQTPDGQTRWIGHVCQPVYNQDGRSLGRRVSNRDVTVKKAAEEALRYQAVLLDHLSDAVIASDQNYRLTAWNKAAERLYGWKADEVLGKIGLDVVQTEFLEGSKPGILASISEAGHYYGEATQVRKDGTRFPVEVRSIVLHDDSGQICGYLSVNRDITDYKRVQENLLSGLAQIEVQHRLLEHREQERQQIARNLHDGPLQELTGVSISLRELLMDNCPPEIAKKLSAVGDTVKEQIGELRAYAGELRPPTLVTFGLGKAIRAHVETFQEKHAELKIQFGEDQVGELLPMEVRLALFRIYQESLTNIAKHSQASKVTIHLVKTEDQASLEIRDNGRGFDVPADLLNLARNGHLGLVGMRERAEAVGGSLSLFSMPGEGAHIRVVVPLTGHVQAE